MEAVLIEYPLPAVTPPYEVEPAGMAGKFGPLDTLNRTQAKLWLKHNDLRFHRQPIAL